MCDDNVWARVGKSSGITILHTRFKTEIISIL